MKINGLKILILTLLLTSVFANSQSLQPKKIVFNGESGLFISFNLMDSISLKLIDRKNLVKQRFSYLDIFKSLRLENQELKYKFDLSNSQALKYKDLFKIEVDQKKLALENFESQKSITKNVKIKARKDKLLFFGGGLAVGITIFALLAN